MKHSFAIDRRNRVRIREQELGSRLLRVVRSNIFLSPLVRANCGHKLFFRISGSRVHNYCTVTLRSRGILREFRLSRLEFKKFAGLRLLAGVKRSSY